MKTRNRIQNLQHESAPTVKTPKPPPDSNKTFEFNLQTGTDVHWFVRDGLAFTFEARYFRLSCAGKSHPNLGLNGKVGMVGLTKFFREDLMNRLGKNMNRGFTDFVRASFGSKESLSIWEAHAHNAVLCSSSSRAFGYCPPSQSDSTTGSTGVRFPHGISTQAAFYSEPSETGSKGTSEDGMNEKSANVWGTTAANPAKGE